MPNRQVVSLSQLGRFLLAFVCASGMICSALWACQGAGGHHAALVRAASVLALVQAGYFLVQLAQWLRYREVASIVDAAALPHLAVVIPAYNEGPMVARSIDSVLASAYPRNKLRLIVVDDGSTDDTFAHVQAAADAHPGRVQTVRFATNRGKRAALREGFGRATGCEVLATLDSDSVIESATLRALVAPFVKNARVGAVAGSVKVYNRDTWLGRMLDVRYFLAFDFTRAAQSTYGAVAVCPGALSALRADAVLPHLEAWCSQSFFGRPVRHGEDQALTNIVLKQGYDTVFQASARVFTLVPTHYGPLCRMYARWERSFIVEGFAFARFMFTRYRKNRRFWPAVHFAMELLRLATFASFLVVLPSMAILHVGALVRLVAGVILAGLWSALLVLTSERNFRFVFGVAYVVFSLVCLQWIFPYALLTVRDERWGTR